MAQSAKFKCKKCGREFELMVGGLISDINKSTEVVRERDSDYAQKLVVNLDKHRSECKDGEVVLTSIAFVD